MNDILPVLHVWLLGLRPLHLPPRLRAITPHPRHSCTSQLFTLACIREYTRTHLSMDPSPKITFHYPNQSSLRELVYDPLKKRPACHHPSKFNITTCTPQSTPPDPRTRTRISPLTSRSPPPFTNLFCQQKNPLPLEEVAPREGLYVVWYTLLLLMQAFVAI